jgi:hypothetical protein
MEAFKYKRKFLFSTTALGLTLVLCNNSASSQTFNTGTFGFWTTYEGRVESGRLVCGVRGGGAQALHFKHFQGENNFWINIFNMDWTFDQAAPALLSIRLGRYRWELNGTAHPRRLVRGIGYAPAQVEMSVRYEGSAPFWNAFRSESEGSIEFLTGTEGAWRLNLTGSNAAVSRFSACVSRLGGDTRAFDVPRVGANTGNGNLIPKPPLRQGASTSPF